MIYCNKIEMFQLYYFFFHFLFLTARERKRLAYIVHVPTAICGRFRVQRQYVGHAFIPSICKRLRNYFCEITFRRRSGTWFWFLDFGEYTNTDIDYCINIMPLKLLFFPSLNLNSRTF
jgi:hypothetical protein